MPFISDINCAASLSSVKLEPEFKFELRAEINASIPSKYNIDGAACLATLNTSRNARSLSPMNREIIDALCTEIKFTPLSLASALANNVLPVPLLPCNKMPLTGLILNLLNNSACLSGQVTACINSDLMSSRPPTSCHDTSGISTKTSRTADGSISNNALAKCLMLTSKPEIFSYGISCVSRLTYGKISRTHAIAASLANASKSAPTKPCDKSAIRFKSTSLANGIPRV